MKFAAAILLLSFLPHAFATTSDAQIKAIQIKMHAVDDRLSAARQIVLTDLTPIYISDELSALRRMILNLLTPENDQDYVAGEDRVAYLEWARIYNRDYGRPNRHGYQIRASVLPLRWKKISPELYRLLLERAKLQTNFSAIQWNKSVTWNNLPLAIRILRFGMDESFERRSQYESLLDQTRKITPTQLKILLFDLHALFTEKQMLDSEKLGRILRMQWREADATLKRIKCMTSLRGNSPQNQAPTQG